jgi:hypothetical protein
MTTRTTTTRDLEKVGDGLDRLPVKLTDTELLEHGQRLARLEDEFAEHQRAFDSLKGQFKAKETELEAKRTGLSLAIRDKSVVREVPVEHWHDWRMSVAYTVRADTGERVAERPLSPVELQRAMDFALSPPAVAMTPAKKRGRKTALEPTMSAEELAARLERGES